MKNKLTVAISVYFALFLFVSGTVSSQEQNKQKPEAVVKVSQESGKVFYWVLPGTRKLDPTVFGTPDKPEQTLKGKLDKLNPDLVPPSVPKLLKDLPFLVGVPVKARELTENGEWILKKPTLFSNNARPISKEKENRFSVTFKDYVQKDQDGKPGNTPDRVDLDAVFHDPAGNRYRVEVDHVVQPPFPGYRTEGGVMLNSYHHGTTGTGSPLMPKVYTYGAFWGVGDLYVNGELEEENKHRVIHLMTTEVVRDKEYRLVLDEDLPLSPEERHIKDQKHHTHIVVLPVQVVKGKGPVKKPLKTAFQLKNGKPQPFIHGMFEQDEIESWPFESKPPRNSSSTDKTNKGDSSAKKIKIVAREYKFVPDKFSVKPGQKVIVTFENKGTITHDFHIKELDIKTEPIQPGNEIQYSFVAPEKPTTLKYECKVSGHPAAGMKGKVIVEEE